MGKNIFLVILAAVVLVGAGFLISRSRTDDTNQTKTTASPSPTTGQELIDVTVQEGDMTVSITGMAFSPDVIKIKKGATVTWTNNDESAHSVISSGSDVLKSTVVSKGQTYSHTFTEVGTISYRCGVHPFMNGTIQVVE